MGSRGVCGDASSHGDGLRPVLSGTGIARCNRAHCKYTFPGGTLGGWAEVEGMMPEVRFEGKGRRDECPTC